MRSGDLNNEQLTKLRKNLRPRLHYLRKLKSRMLATGFPAHDSMLRNVLIAELALASLLDEIETRWSYTQKSSKDDDMDPRQIF